MRFSISTAAVLLVTTAPAFAGGIDRSGQFLGPLFEPGNYGELSFGYADPDVSGKESDLVAGPGLTLPGGDAIGDVTGSYNMLGLAYKHQYTDNWSAAVIVDQPFGADINYPASDSPFARLAGTEANVSNVTVTGVARYFMPENGFGVHAGFRALTADADVSLRGVVYGPVNGYSADFDTDTAYGWLAGVSWEKPEIAARVALTYNSEVEHEFNTSESLGGASIGPNGITKVKMPKSVNIEFQTGLNEKTLAFGSIRWVDWSSFKVAPPTYSQLPDPCNAVPGACAPGTQLGSLTSLEDTTTLTLGVGRKFTDTWSGAASILYEKTGDDLVSPLAPTNGKKGITLAAIYTRDKMKITTGISYIKVGDALPETGTPDTERASMQDNDAWGIGVKVGYSF